MNEPEATDEEFTSDLGWVCMKVERVPDGPALASPAAADDAGVA